MTLRDLSERGFNVHGENHVEAVLVEDFPAPLAELCAILSDFSIEDRELIKGGGGEAKFTQRLRRSLSDKGWPKQNIKISKFVDGQQRAGTSHEIDHVRKSDKGTIALEIEWNNKDPFFDRDLENFQRLHAEGAISVGIVVTRGKSLQDQLAEIIRACATRHGLETFEDLKQLGVNPTSRQRQMVERAGGDFMAEWSKLFVRDKFGTATTHWAKLLDRVNRGVGNPCPLLLIGIPASIITTGERNEQERD